MYCGKLFFETVFVVFQLVLTCNIVEECLGRGETLFKRKDIWIIIALVSNIIELK